MNKHWGEFHYWTEFFEECSGGRGGLRLYRERLIGEKRNIDPQCVGECVFWDATGGFVIRTFQDLDVAVEIAEELIAETRERIKVR